MVWEMLKPKRSGNSSKRRFRIVLFPAPEGPLMTIGTCAWIAAEPGLLMTADMEKANVWEGGARKVVLWRGLVRQGVVGIVLKGRFKQEKPGKNVCDCDDRVKALGSARELGERFNGIEGRIGGGLLQVGFAFCGVIGGEGRVWCLLSLHCGASAMRSWRDLVTSRFRVVCSRILPQLLHSLVNKQPPPPIL